MIDFECAFDLAWQVDRYGTSYQTIVLCCGAQMGKTDALLDVIGQTIDERPAPILYAGPDRAFVDRELDPRLSQMLLGTRRIAERVATGKRWSKYRKIVGGVPIMLAWAGSASQLAGTAAKIALIDELDRAETNVQGEGDPFTLLEARGFSYADRIRAAISTPVSGSIDVEVDDRGLEFWKVMPAEDVESKTWRLWQQGTRHHYCWPCPECGEHFIPRFKQLRWQGWPDVVQPIQARRTAYLACPHCGGVIEDKSKPAMLAAGCYIAPGQHIDPDTKQPTGPLPETTTLSFWASGLCTLQVTWGERAASYMDAKRSGDESRVQGVVNTGFGECFAPGGGDVPEWEQVRQLAGPLPRLVLPTDARVLTLAVDVQLRRLIYSIRAWGGGASSWTVDFGELLGDTTHADVWGQLADLLYRPIEGMAIRLAFVDSGFRPGKPILLPINRVYEFCRRFPGLVYPTKGKATQDRPIVATKIEVTPMGSARKYGLDLVHLDTDHFKSRVHERLRWEPGQSGGWTLPADVSDYFCRSLISEARTKKPSGAPEWVRRSRENHYLDTEALQEAAGFMLGVHLMQVRAEEEAVKPPGDAERRDRIRALAARASGKGAPSRPTSAAATAAPAATSDRLDRVRELARRMQRR